MDGPNPGNHLRVFLAVPAETALAVGCLTADAAEADVGAAAVAVAARDETAATPGMARPLMLKPVFGCLMVASFWKMDPASDSGPGPAATVLRSPKALKAQLGRPGPTGPFAVTTLSFPRMFEAKLKKPFDSTRAVPPSLALPSRLRARVPNPVVDVTGLPALKGEMPAVRLSDPTVFDVPRPSCKAIPKTPETAAWFPRPSATPMAIFPTPKVPAVPSPS